MSWMLAEKPLWPMDSRRFLLLGMGNRISELRAAADTWWPFPLPCIMESKAVAVRKKQHGVPRVKLCTKNLQP